MGNGEKMPVKKAMPLTIIAVVMVFGVSLLLIKLNLCIWVVWLGMCSWAGFGMKVEWREIVKCWTSGAFGLFLGFLLKSGRFGMTGVVIGFALVAVFIFGMVSHRFGFLCNNYTALFLTVCTAEGITLDPAQLALSILMGFAIFGLIPLAGAAVMKKRKQA